MRRDRNLREHRSKQLAQRKILSISERRRLAQQKAMRRRKSRVIIDNRQKAVTDKHKVQESIILLPDSQGAKEAHHQRLSRTRSGRSRLAKKMSKTTRDLSSLPSTKSSDFQFISIEKFFPSDKVVRVCHLIESLGLGGAQTMMMELVNGLNSY